VSCRLVEQNLAEEERFSSRQPLYLRLLGWDCPAECRYSCMWKTVHDFELDKSPIPQFYGKVVFNVTLHLLLVGIVL